jgi:hypothetical protein
MSVVLSSWERNVCKMECMQLQEDRCRPGCMQLKLKKSVVLGVSHPFFHPLPEFTGISGLNHFVSASGPLHSHMHL